MDHRLQEAPINGDFNGKESSFKNLKRAISTLEEPKSGPSVGFDCNICLDLVQDPVVTFCGHLYCWPCIYRWISFQQSPLENPDCQNPKCPVCKAEVSENMLVPLYGRGSTASPSKEELLHPVPKRPSTPRYPGSMFLPNLHRRGNAVPAQQYRTGSYVASSMADPMMGMFGEMVYARIFGNSETTLHAYPNSYHLAGSNTPRLRRRMMQVERSLSRVCFFLCCCMVLCLVLF